MKKIVLLCGGGMSTSILARKMEKAGQEIDYPVDVHAYGVGELCKVAKDADLILIGPQIRYLCDKVKTKVPDKLVEVIDMKDYGAMDGKKVLMHAKTLFEN